VPLPLPLSLPPSITPLTFLTNAFATFLNYIDHFNANFNANFNTTKSHKIEQKRKRRESPLMNWERPVPVEFGFTGNGPNGNDAAGGVLAFGNANLKENGIEAGGGNNMNSLDIRNFPMPSTRLRRALLGI
jgi:hypothetical protein